MPLQLFGLVWFFFAAGQMSWTGGVQLPSLQMPVLCHTFSMPILLGPRIPALSHKMILWLVTSHKSLNNASLLRSREAVYKEQLLFISWVRGSFLLSSQELARGGNGIG